MGYYIETPEKFRQLKAMWIGTNMRALYISGKPSQADVPEGYVPVCVVDAGHWDAAGIAVDEQEAERFANPIDSREKEWLLVPIEEVIKNNPKVAGLINWSK